MDNTPQPAPGQVPEQPRQPLQPYPVHSNGVLKYIVVTGVALLLLVGLGIGLYYLMGGSTTSTNSSSSSSSASQNTASSPLEGMQEKARDSERKADVAAISTWLEVYYNEHGYYPSIEQLADNSWVEANFAGLDTEALYAPTKNTNSFRRTNTPTVYDYGYVPMLDGDTCYIQTGCDSYTLYWRSEVDNQVISKEAFHTKELRS